MPAHKRKDLASEGNDEENRDDEEMKEEVMNGEIGSEAEKGEEVKDQKEEKEEESKLPDETLPDLQAKHEDSDAEGNSQSSHSACDGDEFVLVKLAEIRKEVQCPICLGIIRKTRTVMECLHRFCRDCIDKSMRLSNNECPACRTHCASRRSLRDDPNFDALISALYPDIDKYEEEELAVSEGEKTRNKKIQESIAETFRRQTEALGKKKSTSGSRARIPRRKSRGRGRSSGADTIMAGSEEEEEEEEALNGNERTKESSSSDDVRPIKRSKRSARNSPAKQLAGNSDENGDENEKEGTGVSSSPLKGVKEKEKEKEVTGVSLSPLSWGKNGTRSQTRHGASTSLAGRLAKGGRVAKLMDHLKSLDDSIKEVEMHVSMIPLKGESLPSLKMPYLCCKQGLSIQQLCQFVAVNLSRGVEEVEIYAKRNDEDKLAKLEILHHENVISKLHVSEGNLELVYGLKVRN